MTVKTQKTRSRMQRLRTSCRSSRSRRASRWPTLTGRKVEILLSQENVALLMYRVETGDANASAGDEWGVFVNGVYEVSSERDEPLNGPTFKQPFKVNRDGERRYQEGDESHSGHPRVNS